MVREREREGEQEKNKKREIIRERKELEKDKHGIRNTKRTKLRMREGRKKHAIKGNEE